MAANWVLVDAARMLRDNTADTLPLAVERLWAQCGARRDVSAFQVLAAMADLLLDEYEAGQLVYADLADRLLDEYERRQPRPCAGDPPAPARARVPLQLGRYTVRPADEREAAVIEVADPHFGQWAPGTLMLSMHGAFEVRGVARSWVPFAAVNSSGRVNLFRSMRALVEADPATLDDADRHTAAKARLARKAAELLATFGLEQRAAAYAAAESRCYVCHRPLKREQAQRAGVGPECRKRLAAMAGAA